MKKKYWINSYTFIQALILVIAVVFYSGCGGTGREEVSGVEHAELRDAPYVPSPVSRDHPTKVIVDLEVREVAGKLADGVEYVKWTFGGKVPGKFIRIREGDMVEFNLHNHPSSKLPHNIDLHAVTGPGGGAVSSFTAPGHTSTFSFTALNPGLYIYHCATAPVGLHIANGMYGLILVEPKEGLPKVDREYYVLQSEFYTEGNYGDPGLQPFSMSKALDERPPYVVFNGAVGSLTDDNAIKAHTGETVRIYFGNAGPNLTSSFHIIGEIFDHVYAEGGTKITQTNVGTTLVPAGGTTIVDFKVEVPGTYILVDHAIFRAFNKGALGMLKVSGEEAKDIYSGKQSDKIYLGASGAEDQSLRQAPDVQPSGESNAPAETDIKKIVAAGRDVFVKNCIACHQSEGQGLPNVFPPLAGSDYLMADKQRSIKIVKHGLTGPVTVNGKTYNGTMPQLNLTDSQIAEVLSFVRSSWGNNGGKVTIEEVKKVQ